MAKARILAAVIIGVLLLSALAPGIASGAAPTVTNLAPYDGATDIMLMPTLKCTYGANPDVQSAAWWQVSTVDNFSTVVWDTGITTNDLVILNIPRGYLLPETTYYWHVKVQDAIGYWSAWSATWSFTTVKGFAPDRPENKSPANGTTEISPDQRLQASDYYDSEGDVHYASQWQVAASGGSALNANGSYKEPVFDSAIDTGNRDKIALPVGVVDWGTTYYWHVRYMDDMGFWSAWSAETSFTVVTNSPPSSPTNVDPYDGEEDVGATPILTATNFSDADASAYIALTDSHAASQWQMRLSTGTYVSPVLDNVTIPVTSLIVLGGLAENTTYYWRVRYQDSRGNWSGYSSETSFTTKAVDVPVASFVADKTEVVAGWDLVTFTDNSTPVGEIGSWSWDFGDGTTEVWASEDERPPNGEITHKYLSGGTRTVKLTVYNRARPAGVSQTMEIVVHGKPVASFTFTPAAPKAGKEITFTDNTSEINDIESWEWQFDDGTTVTWTAANRPADRKLTHVFKKGGEHAATLIVKGKGDLGDSIYNRKINVKGGGGFQFGLWMIAVGVGVVVVIAGVVYLVRARRATK